MTQSDWELKHCLKAVQTVTVTGYFSRSNLYSQTKNRNNIFLHSVPVTKRVTRLTSATPTGGLCQLEMHRVTTPSPRGEKLCKTHQSSLASFPLLFLPYPPGKRLEGCKHCMLDWAYSQSLSYRGRHSRIFRSSIWNAAVLPSLQPHVPELPVIRTQISLSWIHCDTFPSVTITLFPNVLGEHTTTNIIL